MSLVLHRYLGRELLLHWLMITLVLWLVLVAARFSLYLEQAASGQLPAGAVLSLLGLKSVGFFVFLMPLALFLALLWVLGRLNRDNESLVLLASGVGPGRLYRAVAPPVLLVTLLVGLLSAYLVPRTAQQGYQLRTIAAQGLGLDNLAPGRFHQLGGGRWLVMALRAGSVPGRLERVFVHVRDARRPQVLVADSARIEGSEGADRFLVLSDGYRYDGVPGRADYAILRYRQYAMKLQAPAARPAKKWDAVPTLELWRDADPQAAAELQTRLSRPVSVLVLALVAVPLARFRPGLSRYYPLWLGVMVFTVYFNLLNVGQLWVAQQRVPVGLGLWWVHALFVLPLAGMFALSLWRASRDRFPS
ncbi:MAG: LPS export ABC transporter permease LptF [Gammaproteobacteria bacterium]|jgi:lipopolysaccharide export system permease protein